MSSTTLRFRAALARHFGLAFDASKQTLLDEVLQRRTSATRTSVEEYVALVESGAGELRALAQELTIGETYFFRHKEQFQAYTHVLSDLRGRSVRVLSAGCASGEEAYSLAIIARLAGFEESAVRVVGVDLNVRSLEKARRARYSRWALRETSAELQSRWFTQEGVEFDLDDAVRRSVRFEERNLSYENADLWAERFDVVFCRNVLMYFTESAARAVVARAHRALAPSGHLFLGHAETMRGLSSDFHLCHTHGTFYYQHKERTAEVDPAAQTPRPAVEIADTSSWVESIRLASERIRALTATKAPAAGPKEASREERLRDALDLMQQERLDAALSIVRSLHDGAAVDQDAWLLRAVLSVQRGLLEEAEETSRALIAADELNAGAHHVLALCHEAREDLASAVEHDRIAAYLEPSFAMPRLHLGLMGKRMGKRAEARAEFEQAIDLLLREDASRLLLFGGGFRRDALVALARAELEACRGEA